MTATTRRSSPPCAPSAATSPNTAPGKGGTLSHPGTALAAATFLAYGLAVQFAAATGAATPALGLLLFLSLAGAAAGWRRRRAGALLSLALAAAVLWSAASGGAQALYLPPLLINATILWAFARSLAPGRTPLITIFARLMDGEPDAATLRYTRRATVAWSLFLALMLAENLALALWAPAELWSLFAHFINYLLIGAAFAVEYLFRRRCLPDRARGGFLGFIRNLARLDLRALLRGAR